MADKMASFGFAYTGMALDLYPGIPFSQIPGLRAAAQWLLSTEHLGCTHPPPFVQ